LKKRISVIVLALLMVGMLTSVDDLAHELELTPPIDLEDWSSRFFHTTEDELEPFVNVAFTYQNGHDNGAEQIQEGEGHRSYIYQNGDGNVANHRQSGTGNWAGTYQLGNANTATIQQGGNKFSALITQVGNGNSVVIIQGK